MQYLQTHGEATTKQISEAIADVPAPTGKAACYQCQKNVGCRKQQYFRNRISILNGAIYEISEVQL